MGKAAAAAAAANNVKASSESGGFFYTHSLYGISHDVFWWGVSVFITAFLVSVHFLIVLSSKRNEFGPEKRSG